MTTNKKYEKLEAMRLALYEKRALLTYDKFLDCLDELVEFELEDYDLKSGRGFKPSFQKG